ncbi:aminotransferase class I/II-fold pyridoxal phosphate-dependent enzyme [Halocatena halophila]|uniref:aminotransferase class I/II-fold pyridoxal phosphate-dependent enzyme n=1 Tax=Halocatena halophila TaxID=2814576 RepID=UPI002ED3F89D
MAKYDEQERQAVSDVLDHPKLLVGGPYTDELQQRVSTQFGKDHGVLVNSGSSANLVATELLDLPTGSEVITPLVTFSTTVAPLVQKGLVPVFVDIGLGDYQLDIDQVREAISEDTGALMVPSLLGNIPDYPQLREIANDHDIYLVEDSAHTVGATIQGQPTGEFTDITTTSFYGAHVITTFGTGGMVSVNDDRWMRRAKKFRGWGRASAVEEENNINDRLETVLDGTQYDSKFVFDELGYNLIATEASAAFGVEQVKKLPKFADQRRYIFSQLCDFFSEYEEWFVLPSQRPDVTTCWLAFPLTIREAAPFSRGEIVKHLERNRIQTRPLWSGNLLKHPAFESIDARLPFEDYPNANHVMENSLVIGTHQAMDDDDVNYVKTTFERFFEQL